MKNSTHIVSQQSLVKASIASVTEQGFYFTNKLFSGGRLMLKGLIFMICLVSIFSTACFANEGKVTFKGEAKVAGKINAKISFKDKTSCDVVSTVIHPIGTPDSVKAKQLVLDITNQCANVTADRVGMTGGSLRIKTNAAPGTPDITEIEIADFTKQEQSINGSNLHDGKLYASIILDGIGTCGYATITLDSCGSFATTSIVGKAGAQVAAELVAALSNCGAAQGATIYALDYGGGKGEIRFKDLPEPIATITFDYGGACGLDAIVKTYLYSPMPVVTSVITNVACYGTSTGSIVNTIDGGQSPYTYTWNTGAHSKNLLNKKAGTYTVTVTDVEGWSSSLQLTIAQPAKLVTTISKVTVKCAGGTTGKATATTTGGTPPFTYLWSNGATTNVANNLSAGIYTVTVTDANGCTLSKSVTIIQNAPITLSPTATVVSCFGGSIGAATISATGGVPAYKYVWNNGSTLSTITNLAAGTYNVVLTDAKGCIANASINISSPPPLQINVQPMPPSQGFANVFGGVPPYQLFWNTLPPQTGPLATGLFPGQIVQLQVMDNAGCMQMHTFIMPQLKLTNDKVSTTEMKINVYPNPAKDIVTLQLLGVENGIGTIKMFDVVGREMYNEIKYLNNGTEFEIDVRNLPNGIYTLEVTQQGQPFRTKLSVRN